MHGEAIIVGMILASYISTELAGFPRKTTEEIKALFLSYYEKVDIDKSEYQNIIDLLKYDKKNNHGNINFVLLKSIGTAKIDCLVDNSIIIDAFKFYAS